MSTRRRLVPANVLRWDSAVVRETVIRLVIRPATVACIGVRSLGVPPIKPALTVLVLPLAPTNVPSMASGCVRAMAGSSAATMIPTLVWNGATSPSADGIRPASTVPAWTPAKINAS